jgi:hypothetical protein
MLVVGMLACQAAPLSALATEESGLDPRVVELFGEEGLRTLQKPDKVQLFRIPQETLSPQDRKMVLFSAGWPIVDARTISNVVADAASRIVLDPKTYKFSPPGVLYLGNFCGGFAPAFVVRFSRGNGRSVDILLGFGCLEMGVLQPKGRKWNTKSGLAVTVRSDGASVLPMTVQGTVDLIAVTTTEYVPDDQLRRTLAGLILHLHGRTEDKSTAVQHGVAPDERAPAAPVRR